MLSVCLVCLLIFCVALRSKHHLTEAVALLDAKRKKVEKEDGSTLKPGGSRKGVGPLMCLSSVIIVFQFSSCKSDVPLNCTF